MPDPLDMPPIRVFVETHGRRRTAHLCCVVAAAIASDGVRLRQLSEGGGVPGFGADVAAGLAGLAGGEPWRAWLGLARHLCEGAA